MIVCKTGIRAKLVSSSVNSGQKIYYDAAPKSTAYPFVLISLVTELSNDDTSTDVQMERWQVKAVSDIESSAMSLHSAIYNALHYASLTMPTGWRMIDCRHTANMFYQEYVNEIPYYHAAADFRVRVHNTTTHS